jgi:prepilin-type N-terminal cleavage/methylation domain-containing protein
MKRGLGKGFSVLELLIVLLILSLLLIPTMAYFNRYHQALLFDETAGKIVEAMGLAREYAVNERKEFYVVFGDEGFVVMRENKEPVCKEQKFPVNVAVKKKSAGFAPAILKPDGTAQTAGYLILFDSAAKKETKIVLHNLTGRCFISND